MKLTKFFSTLLLMGMACGFASCLNDDDNKHVYIFKPYYLGINDDKNTYYDPETGVWKNWQMNTSFTCDYLIFSHNYDATYGSWTGFTPSAKYSDVYVKDYWPNDQWGCIYTPGKYDNVPFLLAFWDNQESLTSLPADPSCKITFNRFQKPELKRFCPKRIEVNNSTVGYFSMKEGSDFNKKFGPDDWCNLLIWGVQGGARINPEPIKVNLASKGQIIRNWTSVDLSSLGEVDMIYFQLESSDTGQWGMNNAAYFCLRDFQYADR